MSNPFAPYPYHCFDGQQNLFDVHEARCCGNGESGKEKTPPGKIVRYFQGVPADVDNHKITFVRPRVHLPKKWTDIIRDMEEGSEHTAANKRDVIHMMFCCLKIAIN